MLKTFDIVLIGVMTTAAAVTYTIKHRAELKLEEVHHLEAEIKLEKDTIELLKADWALVVQPNRLERLVANYNSEPGCSRRCRHPRAAERTAHAAQPAAATSGYHGRQADRKARHIKGRRQRCRYPQGYSRRGSQACAETSRKAGTG